MRNQTKIRLTTHQQHWAEGLLLLMILMLAAYLRLTNLADNPGWYTDEGTHLDIAQNLLQGRMEYLAINQSTLLFAKLPLFELLLAGMLGLTGGGMETLRLLSGSLGVLSVGLLYLVTRRISGRGGLALLAAGLYATYSEAVLYSRFGFSYNLLPPLVLMTLLGLWSYHRATIPSRRWLALAAIAIGLGAVSDIWMFILALPLTVVILTRRGSDIWWAWLLVWLPFICYAGTIASHNPATFWFDARYTFFLVTKLSWKQQLDILTTNLAMLTWQHSWISLGMLGLFWLRPRRFQWLVLLLFWTPLLVLGRTVALFNLSFYYLIPLLPFIALGVATLFYQGGPLVWRTLYISLLLATKPLAWRRIKRLRRQLLSLTATLMTIALMVTPFLINLRWLEHNVRHEFPTDIKPFLLNPDDSRQAVSFVNQRVAADDLVIASPGLAWLIESHAADFQMSAAAVGRETVHLPANVPAERFLFNPHYKQAKFVVVDNLWRNWAVWNIAGVPEMLDDLEGSWPRIFQAGDIEVYCNPAGKGCGGEALSYQPSSTFARMRATMAASP